MPSSRPDAIPEVIHLLRQLKPQSILDVGVGFGKWGHLFREYTDIVAAEQDPARYRRDHWQVRIEGIEGHAAYLTDMHRFLYNHLWVGNAQDLLPALDRFDLVFLGDVIEHMDKADGMRLLGHALAKASKAVIVSTPKFETGQGGLCANELERHHSLWTAKDFKSFPNASVKTIGGDTLLALIRQPEAPQVQFSSPGQRKAEAENRRRMALTRQAIIDHLPQDTAFILIDDEHIRSLLPHPSVFPFLEHQGVYWGPPAEDAVAIAELERLRTMGAAALVIVWSSFWWLERFPGFAKYLKQNFKAVHPNDLIVLFDLQPTK